MDIPSLLGWQIAHTTNMAHISIPKNDGISSVHGSLGTPTLDFNSRTTSRRFGTTWATVKKPPTQVIKLAGLSPRQEREAPRRQQGLPGTVGPPHRPRPMGGPMGGGSKGEDTATVSSSLDPLQEVGGLSHPPSCGLIVIIVFAMAIFSVSQ